MLRLNIILIISLFFFFEGTGQLFSQEKSSSEVNDLKNLIAVSLDNHPDIKLMMLKRKQITSEKRIASQFLNPEFDSTLLYDFHEKGIKGEYSLTQTIELGGKRNVRIKIAKSKMLLYDKKIILKKQEIVKDIILIAYRLRQINHEIDIVNESITTFGILVGRMNRLPRLNPDLRVTRDVYLLARDQGRQMQKQLQGEALMLKSKLSIYSGVKVSKIDEIIPPKMSQWPEIKDSNIADSPLLAVAIAEKNLAIADYDLAGSSSWPNLTIGPVFGHEPAGNETAIEAGITFSITVPIYHQNDGSREYAKNNKELSKANIAFIKSRLNLLRDSYRKQYDLFKSRFQKAISMKKDDWKHKRVHYLMNRGMVSPSLVIEFHRQELDFYKSVHENELYALKSLWAVYGIDGRIFKEVNYEK